LEQPVEPATNFQRTPHHAVDSASSSSGGGLQTAAKRAEQTQVRGPAYVYIEMLCVVLTVSPVNQKLCDVRNKRDRFTHINDTYQYYVKVMWDSQQWVDQLVVTEEKTTPAQTIQDLRCVIKTDTDLTPISTVVEKIMRFTHNVFLPKLRKLLDSNGHIRSDQQKEDVLEAIRLFYFVYVKMPRAKKSVGNDDSEGDELCVSADPRRSGQTEGVENFIITAEELRRILKAQCEEEDQTVWMTTAQAGFPTTAAEGELDNDLDRQLGKPIARYLHPVISAFITQRQQELVTKDQAPSMAENRAMELESEWDTQEECMESPVRNKDATEDITWEPDPLLAVVRIHD
jgi:hypothetical protein